MRTKTGALVMGTAMLLTMAATGGYGEERPNASQLQERLASGEKALADGDLDKAIADYTEAIRLDPENVLAYCNRGRAQCKTGHVEKATPGYDETSQPNRQEPEHECWNHPRYERLPILGPIRPGTPKNCSDSPSEDAVMCALEQENRNEPLQQDVQRKKVRFVVQPIAVYVDPPRTYPVVGPAILHHSHYRCVVHYTEVTGAGSPDTKTDKEAQKTIYIDQDHLHLVENIVLDKAIADFTEALRLNPRLAEAYGGRGLAYGYKADYKTAIADCAEAVRLGLKLGEVYWDRGVIYYLKGDHDKAIADLTESIRLDPKSDEAYCARAKAYKAKGEDDKAAADYAEAKRLIGFVGKEKIR